MHDTQNGAGGNGAARPSRLGPNDRSELADREAERTALYSLSHYPQLFASCGLTEGDFSHTPHVLIFAALHDLHAAGGDTNMPALRARLIAAGRFGVVGGDEALSELGDALPSLKPPFKRIRELSLRRQIGTLAALVQAKVSDPVEFARYFRQLVDVQAELEALDRPDKARRVFADSVLSLGEVGQRMPTGLPTLDEATRGGIGFGKCLFVLGAPGSSKTNFVTWLGDQWERAGCAVLFIAADEPKDMIVTRFGQLDGFDRDRLECADEGGRVAFAHRVRSRSLDVVDPFDEDDGALMLEDAEALLLQLAGGKDGRPRVLIVDSLQTAPARAHNADRELTRREQIEESVKILKGVAKRGTLVIAISEMSRAGYRSLKADDNISALAAGAESRSIEYAASMIIGLRPVKGETGVTDVEIAKNRLGSGKPDIRISLDFDTLRFREIDKPDTETAQVEGEVKRFGIARDKIAAAVRRDKLGQLRTLNAIVIASRVKRALALQVVRDMLEEGAIVKVEGMYRLGPAGGC